MYLFSKPVLDFTDGFHLKLINGVDDIFALEGTEGEQWISPLDIITNGYDVKVQPIYSVTLSLDDSGLEQKHFHTINEVIY